MKLRNHYLYAGLFVSIASTLGACSAAPGSEPLARSCGQALKAEQGLSLNGYWANGFWANGYWANGVWGNGFFSNGLWFNGLWSNGIWLNGFFSNGFWVNGVWGNGFFVNGIWANGVTQTGELQGLALRGLTLEEAAELTASDEFEIAPEHLLALGLDDGVLRAGAPDGTIVSGTDLVGVLIPFFVAEGDVQWLRIGAAEPHPDAPELTVYALHTQSGENPCGEGGSGFFVPGIWDETGARHDSVTYEGVTSDASFSCTTGVIAKCAVWGYAPWSAGTEAHQTCTRLARADYCGNGVPHTENGTLIDVYDVHGIQTPVESPDLSFEAGWGTDGAVCVNQPRYIDIDAAGTQVLPSCWGDLPTCDTWLHAQSLGAELGNDSAHTTREVSCTD